MSFCVDSPQGTCENRLNIRVSSEPWIIGEGIVIASLVIIGVGIFMLILQPPWKSWSTFLVLISSSVGLCCFLILFLGFSLNIKMDGARLYTPQYGAFLSAVGYILSVIGVLSSFESENSPESQDTQEIEENP